MSCIIKRFMYYILHISKQPEKKIYTKYKKTVLRHPGEYVTSFELVDRYEKTASFCRYDEMFPLNTILFEGVEVKIQKNYDKILTNLYGRYMEMPPIDRRFNTPPAVLDFGDRYGNRMRR